MFHLLTYISATPIRIFLPSIYLFIFFFLRLLSILTDDMPSIKLAAERLAVGIYFYYIYILYTDTEYRFLCYRYR